MSFWQATDSHLPVTVDNWISFASSERIAGLVKELRIELDKLLEHKISHPGATSWEESSKEGALMNAIINLVSREELTKLEHLLPNAWDDAYEQD